MFRYTCLLLLLLTAVCNPSIAQKISNIDFDEISRATKDSTSNLYYPSLLKRFISFDTTLTRSDFTAIYYGNINHENYSPYGSSETESKFLQTYRAGNFNEAIPLGEKVLDENPVNLTVLFKMLICYHQNGRKDVAARYAGLYYGLLDAIYHSGDGKSKETAYVVLKVPDEYEILSDLELERTRQALIGDTDVLYIDKKGQKPKKGEKKITELYFNVSMPLGHLTKMLREKE